MHRSSPLRFLGTPPLHRLWRRKRRGRRWQRGPDPRQLPPAAPMSGWQPTAFTVVGKEFVRWAARPTVTFTALAGAFCGHGDERHGERARSRRPRRSRASTPPRASALSTAALVSVQLPGGIGPDGLRRRAVPRGLRHRRLRRHGDGSHGRSRDHGLDRRRERRRSPRRRRGERRRRHRRSTCRCSRTTGPACSCPRARSRTTTPPTGPPSATSTATTTSTRWSSTTRPRPPTSGATTAPACSPRSARRSARSPR